MRLSASFSLINPVSPRKSAGLGLSCLLQKTIIHIPCRSDHRKEINLLKVHFIASITEMCDHLTAEVDNPVIAQGNMLGFYYNQKYKSLS